MELTSSATYTVLFTDLVDSTAQRARLGDDAADDLNRRHQSILRGAVEHHGGRVVKTTGDGIMAAFHGAADGLACAVTIQQDINEFNHTSPEHLSVRSGLSLGDARVEDDDLHGTPVVEAARLCAQANGGEILCAEIVRLVAGSRAPHTFTPVGSLDLKGLPEPIVTFRVEWAPRANTGTATVGSIPFPRSLQPGTRFPFVGRRVELDGLVEQWHRAVDGRRSLVLLAGEPGIGKTRLASEVARRAYRDGTLVLHGRCDDEIGIPYQPFVEALTFFVDHTDDAELAGSLGRHPGELVRLVPHLGDRVADLPAPLSSDPETEQYRLFEAVASWLAAASAERPLLLVLDDLQWAGKPTLLLLRHIAGTAESAHLLVVATYRDTDVQRTHPLGDALADLRRLPGVLRYALSGLEDEDVVALLTSTAGHELQPAGIALAHAIYAETDGNPLFAGEVLRHLAETGAVVQRDGMWVTVGDVESIGIPEGVREVIGRRLNRLSDETNKVLELAAVIGRSFQLAVLAKLTETDADELAELLDPAVDARIVREVGVGDYVFAHALFRSALYDEVRPTRRARLHRRVADAISAVYPVDPDPHVGELAYHYAHSVGAGDAVKAIEYARLAGERALTQLAHEEAVGWFKQARDLLEDGGDAAALAEVLYGLGVAEKRAGEAEYRTTLLEAAAVAERAGDVELLANAALANSRGFYSHYGVVDKERVGVLERALAALGPADRAERACLLATLAFEVVFVETLERRRALTDEALAVAQRVGNNATLVQVLISRCLAIWHPSTLDERLDASAYMFDLATSLADPYLEYFAGWYRFAACVEAGAIGDADAVLSRMTAVAREIGQPTPQWMDVFTLSGRALLAGDMQKAEELNDEQAHLGEASGNLDAGFYFGVLLFAIRRDQGRLLEIAELVELVAAEDDPTFGSTALWGVTLCELERDAEAAAILERLAQGNFGAIGKNQVWSSIIWAAALIAGHLGDRARAEELYDLLAPYESQLVYPGLVCFDSIGSLLGVLALTCGRAEVADAHFARAEALEEAIGAPALLARTRRRRSGELRLA